MSHNELLALHKYLDENLSNGFIWQLSSPARSPVLFVKKLDGFLRLGVDHRGLNEVTIKNRYPLLLIQKTLMHLQKSKFLTTLDIRTTYNLVQMAEDEEWTTAFYTG
jgi:hypothetical protein